MTSHVVIITHSVRAWQQNMNSQQTRVKVLFNYYGCDANYFGSVLAANSCLRSVFCCTCWISRFCVSQKQISGALRLQLNQMLLVDTKFSRSAKQAH
jgi:hypothetical protein